MTLTPAVPDLYSIPFGRTGPLVVFCHGLFGQGRNWAQIAKHLGLSGFRTLLLDMPDHGRSGWTERFSYLGMADTVATWLATSPEVAGEPIRLVGHSMGGKVAMLLALRHPELVDRLCVVDIAPVTYRGHDNVTQVARAAAALDLHTLTDRHEAAVRLTDAIPDRGVRSWLLTNLIRDAGGWRWTMNLALLAANLDRIAGWPEIEGRWGGPVLWVKGGDSDFVRPAYAPLMQRYFPATRRIVVKDAGHWVQAEQPQVFTAVLERFLREGR